MTQDWLTVASPQLQVKTWSALVNIQYRSKVSYKSCLYAIARYENRVVRYRNRVALDENRVAGDAIRVSREDGDLLLSGIVVLISLAQSFSLKFQYDFVIHLIILIIH